MRLREKEVKGKTKGRERERRKIRTTAWEARQGRNTTEYKLKDRVL